MVILIIILAVMALVGVLFMACVSEMERRHALWDLYHHPPDRVDDQREEDKP